MTTERAAPIAARPVARLRAHADHVALLVLLLVVYAPTYLRSYGWSDDYPTLTDAIGLGGPSVSSHVIAGGRPLLAPVFDVSFAAAGSIDGLRYLRLLGVLGVALTGMVALTAFRRAGMARRLALPVAVAVCLLPTFQTWAAWAMSWSVGYGSAVAGVGGLLLVGAGRADRRHLVLGGLCVALAFLLYQPSAMFVWLPFAAELVVGRRTWAWARAALVRHVVVVAAGLVTAVLVAALVTVVTDTDILARADLLRPSGLVAKVKWFVSRPIVIGARPFLVGSPSAAEAAITAVPVLVLLLAGLLLRWQAGGAERLRLVGVALVAIPLAFVPNLVIEENQFDFRLLAGVAPIMLLYIVVGVVEVVDRLARSQAGLLLPAGAWILVGVAGVGAWNLVDDLFVAPSVAGTRYVEEELARLDPAEHREVAVVVPDQWPSRPRLGIYSTTSDLSHGWVAEPLVQLVLDERGIRWTRDRIRVVPRRPSARPEVFVLDTTPLRDHACEAAGARCPGPT